MTSISVRQAVLADLSDLAPLFDAYRQFYGQGSDLAAAREFLRARFEHGESTLFIAHAGATPVGLAQLYPAFSSISLRRIFVLNDLFVSREYRKGGAGSALLGAAAAFGRTLGAQSLFLSTAVTNTAAQSVYSAGGWKRDDEYYVYELPLGAG